ncbi:MAG: 1,4-dihydroxy-2-naphthoate polyprenyltransferase [Chitinophagales bacterium]
MNKNKLQAWLYAFRLRTLPLAFSSIITGSSVAFMLNRSSFSWLVFGLCLLTTLLLQILSNLANDYGDSEKGTDNEDRIGPKRAVQAGMLSFKEIKTGIIVAVILSLISGSLLIKFALGDALNVSTLGFFLLGLAAIGAAIKYTVGTGAYGYMGLGDVFVLLFFGFVGVGGSYYLQAKTVDWAILLPGFTIGAFASGVLNLNNMRDRISDAKAGKNTLVVKLGAERAKTYHTVLIWLAFMAALAFAAIRFKSTMQFSFILTLPLFRKHLVSVKRIENPAEFDPFLKQLAISTFIFSLLFAFGMMISE